MLPRRLFTTTQQTAIKVLLFFIAIVLIQTKTPPVVNAQQSENNTAVFSGQFIPAFIGSAYDPSVAYQRMAGLPVYVFSYDSWGGNTFVINNLAVRTQIRSDGSFQAQGLPNGQKFGVYFPFRGIPLGTTGVSGVERTDCLDTSEPLCADQVSPDDVPFRMPLPNNTDRILDVFSYNMADASHLKNITTQLGESIKIGLTFLTQETRVDIANNINTFPLVPTTTLKITSKPIYTYGNTNIISLNEETSYEVVARRIWFDQGTGSNFRYRIGDNLVVRGKTTFPIESTYQTGVNRPKNDRTFMAYAPPGIYAVTIWRNDGGVSYQTLDPAAPSINSMFSGFGIMRIDRVENGAPTHDLDWANLLSEKRRNDIPILNNAFIVWGRVFAPNGSSWSGNTNIRLFASQPDLSFFPKQRQRENDPCSVWTPFTVGGPLVETHPGNSNCTTDPGGAAPLNISSGPTDNSENGFQTYAFLESAGFDLSSPRAVVIEPYISETTKDNTPVQIPLFLSTKGPVQQDLTVNEPPTNGILITVNSSNLSLSNVHPSKHAFYVQVSKGDITDIRTIPAIKQQFYLSDAAGTIYIPHGDLLPLEGNDLATNPISLLLTVYGTDNSVPQELAPIDYDGTLPPTQSVTLAAYAPGKAEGFKFLGILPARLLMPGARDSMAASATEADFSIQFSNAKTYQSVVLYNNLGNEIWHLADSYLEGKSGTWTHQTQLEYKKPDQACAGVGRNREMCQSAVDKSNTYTIVATADGSTLSESVVIRHSPEQSIAVASPNTWQADFTTECQKLKTSMIEEIDKETEAAKAGLGPVDAERISINIQGSFNKLTDATIPYIGCNISLRFSNIVSKGLQSFHELLLLEPLTISIAVITTWNLLRNIGNVLFVFILLIVGINHALGYDIKNWGANVMLPEIIKGILFSNLSLLIVQGILDINNILTSWIFAIVFDVLETTGLSANAIAGTGAVGGVFALSSFFGGAISSGIAAAIAAIGGSGGTLAIPLIGVLLSGALMLLGFLITLFGIFFGRYLIIWILTITAPVFLALSVLPWFRSMRTLWIKTVIPVATMQTVTALFIAIGILMLSKSAEADGLLIQAGIFLIGGGALFMSIKSPSITAQFLGGGGLAGQAFGALQGLSKGLGSFATQKAGAVSEYTSLENVEQRREEKRNRAMQREIRDQRHEEKYGKKPSIRSRFVNRLTDNRYAEQLESRDKKISDQVAARGKLAEQTALGPKFDVINDPDLDQDEKDFGLRGAFRGKRYRGQEAAYQKNYAPSVHVMTKTGVKPKEFEALKTGIDANAGVDTNWGNAIMRDDKGKAIERDGRIQTVPGASTPKTFDQFMAELHGGDTFKGLTVNQAEIDKILDVRNMKDFEKLDKDVQARIVDEIRLRSRQNAPGTPANQAAGTSAVLDIGQFIANGRRRARQYEDGSSMQTAPSSGGGTSGGNRTP